MPTSAILIIGNEILSGRTQDTNLNWLAKQLAALGIPVREARTVPDIEEEIVAAVNALRSRYDYVFTTGGIGPTHDDITTESVARALGVKVVRHPEAEKALHAHYGDQINEARLTMADVPEGAALIPNHVTSAPGYRIENVYVFAGVPSICKAMFDAAKGELKGGAPVVSRAVSAFVTEGTLAARLAEIQAQFPQVDIGSYPFLKNQRLGTTLVARGTDASQVERACAEIVSYLNTMTDEVELGE